MDSASSCSSSSDTDFRGIEGSDWPWRKQASLPQLTVKSRNPFRRESIGESEQRDLASIELDQNNSNAGDAHSILSRIPTRFEVQYAHELQGITNEVAVRSLVAALSDALRTRTLHGTLLTRNIQGWHALRFRDKQDAVLALVCSIFQTRGWHHLVLQVGQSPTAAPPVLALRGQRTKRRGSVDAMLKTLKLKRKRREPAWTAKELLLAERPATPLFFDFTTS